MNHVATGSGDTGASVHDKEVLVELVGLHARVLRRMPWVQASLALAIALFVLPSVSVASYLAWATLTVGVEAVRALYARKILDSGTRIDPRREHMAFVALAGLSGLSVGLGAVAFLPQLPVTDQALFGAILFAMPAAGVAVSQSSRYIVAAYALAMLIPASWTWMTHHDSQAVAVFALTLLYCSLIITVAADGDKLLLRSVLIRHQRDVLVRDLETRNAQVKAAMDEAEQSARARERVLAAASHDLRQPLHALSIYSAVLAADPSTETQREVAANVGQLVRSLGGILDGMLDLSRFSSGKYVADPRPVALHEIVGSVCAEYQFVARTRGLDLSWTLQQIDAVTDPLAVSRIVRNLVDNALKYTDRGQVRVSLFLEGAREDRAAVIKVADTGRGIPEEEHDRIFEEFYQVDNPGRDRTLGVGLGLAIVRRLCDIAGARISLRSRPGEGSDFFVRIKAGEVSAPSGDSVPAIESIELPEAGYVLMLDDEVDVLKSMSRLMEVWGIPAVAANSLEEAERLLDTHGCPDLLLTDLRLGAAEDGAAFARRMQTRFGPFPVLVLTGEVSAAASRRLETLEYPTLRKPIEVETLKVRIKGLLRHCDAPDAGA